MFPLDVGGQPKQRPTFGIRFICCQMHRRVWKSVKRKMNDNPAPNPQQWSFSSHQGFPVTAKNRGSHWKTVLWVNDAELLINVLELLTISKLEAEAWRELVLVIINLTMTDPLWKFCSWMLIWLWFDVGCPFWQDVLHLLRLASDSKRRANEWRFIEMYQAAVVWLQKMLLKETFTIISFLCCPQTRFPSECQKLRENDYML